jgi:hypothetical protein
MVRPAEVKLRARVEQSLEVDRLKESFDAGTRLYWREAIAIVRGDSSASESGDS